MNRTELIELIIAGKDGEIESLRDKANKLEELDLADVDVLSFSFKIDDIADDKISDLIKEKNLSNQGKWVYVFCADNLSGLLKEFKYTKETEKDKKFSQANDVENPNCVYVGSSNDKLKTRMAQHFGKSPVGTYAIRFNEWLPNNEKITCFCFEVKTPRPDVLQALENGIWDNLRPIIGKRGGK